MRRLSAAEREVMRAIVLAGAPDEHARAALLAQVETTTVAGVSCGCGCASVSVTVDRAAAPPAAVSEISADAVCGGDVWGFRVLLADGYLDDIEFFGYSDSDNTTWPPAACIE